MGTLHYGARNNFADRQAEIMRDYQEAAARYMFAQKQRQQHKDGPDVIDAEFREICEPKVLEPPKDKE